MSNAINNKPGYAWLILIGCCCAEAGAFAAVINLISVYALPIIKTTGFGAGDYMFFMTLYGIMAVIALPVMGNLMQKKNFNVVTTVAALVIVLSLLMLSMSADKPLPWFWFWGALLAWGVSPIFAVMVPTLMGNWFSAKCRGRYLGIATAFTGVGTFVWAPLFTAIIQNLGWETSYVINAALVAVLTLPFTIFIFKLKPSDKGLLPYGYDETVDSGDAQKAAKGSMTTGQAMKTLAFWLCALVILAFSFGNGYQTNMVAICTTQTAGVIDPAEAAVIGGWMVSIAAVGNIISKILFGVLNDKVGLKATFASFIVITFIGYALWIIYPNAPLLIIGALLFGMHNAIVSVGFPLLVRAAFGDKDFAPILSSLMVFNSLAGAITSTVAAYFFQLTGSYVAWIIVGMVMCVIAMICFFSIMSIQKKRNDAKATASV